MYIDILFSNHAFGSFSIPSYNCMFVSYSNRYTLNNINDEREVDMDTCLFDFFFCFYTSQFLSTNERENSYQYTSSYQLNGEKNNRFYINLKKEEEEVYVTKKINVKYLIKKKVMLVKVILIITDGFFGYTYDFFL